MILPAFLHLPLLKATLNPRIQLGAQDCSIYGEGAYTGEVSCDHLKDYEIQYVLVGHSEHRKTCTQEDITTKVKQAWDCGLNLVYCVGENQVEHDEELNETVIHQ